MGYMVASAGSISEIEAGTPAAAVGMAAGWCLAHGSPSGRVHGDTDGHYTVGVRLLQWHALGEVGRALGRFAENVSVGSDHNWKILDWGATVAATLVLRASTAQLAAGRVTITFTDLGIAITLAVDSQGVSSVTEEIKDVGTTGALEVDSMTALRLLFGPLPPEAVATAPAGNAASERALATLGAWCPLPLYTPSPDSV